MWYNTKANTAIEKWNYFKLLGPNNSYFRKQTFLISKVRMSKEACLWVMRCLFQGWEAVCKLCPGKNFQPEVINTERKINQGANSSLTTVMSRTCCSHRVRTILSPFNWEVTNVHFLFQCCSERKGQARASAHTAGLFTAKPNRSPRAVLTHSPLSFPVWH